MKKSTQKKWNQTATSIKLRELEINAQKRENNLQEQLSLLNTKMDKILDVLEDMRDSKLNQLGSKFDEGTKLQSENDREIMQQIQGMEEMIKRLNGENSSRQEKDFEELEELMKLILANELIKPMVSKFN